MNYKSFDEINCFINVEELQNLLGICRVKAYEITHQKDFPLIKVGKRRLIPKEGLIKWIERNGGIN